MIIGSVRTQKDDCVAGPVVYYAPDSRFRPKMIIEKKFEFDSCRGQTALAAARQLLKPDPFPSSIVYSLYFDTLNDDFLAEKENSDYIKNKVRLRWYADDFNGKNLGRVFLEVKGKLGNRRFKHRIDMSDRLGHRRMDSLSLQDVVFIQAELKQLIDPALEPLLPRLFVRYRRDRFIADGARINVDTDIAVRSASISGWKALERDVIEVKDDSIGIKAPINALLSMVCAHKQAFSKYMLGCHRVAQVTH